MPYIPKNTRTPSPGDLWRHIATDTVVLLLRCKGDSGQCAVMNGPTVGRLRMEIPLKKLRSYGNRGFEFLRKRKGKVPRASKKAGFYDPRLNDLGAL